MLNGIGGGNKTANFPGNGNLGDSPHTILAVQDMGFGMNFWLSPNL